jgi:hypothetical protein
MPIAYSAVSGNNNIFVVPGSANPDEDNANLRDALTVAFTAAKYHGDDPTYFVNVYTQFKANSGTNCSNMNQVGKDLCCNSNNQYTNIYGVCGVTIDPLTFYYRVRSRYSSMQYGMDVLGRYLSAAETCGGCTKDEWFDSTCAKIKIYAPGTDCTK